MSICFTVVEIGYSVHLAIQKLKLKKKIGKVEPVKIEDSNSPVYLDKDHTLEIREETKRISPIEDTQTTLLKEQGPISNKRPSKFLKNKERCPQENEIK
jgi:hypothetical protein